MTDVKTMDEKESLLADMLSLVSGDAKDPEMEKMLRQVIFDNKKPYEMAGLKSETIDWIHRQGYEAYTHGKYVKARNAFATLRTLDPDNFDYAMALAGSHQQLKDYLSATQTYAMCMMLDKTNPLPYFYSSECFLQLGMTDLAALMLSTTVQLAAIDARYSNLKEQAEALLNGMKGNPNRAAGDSVPQQIPEITR